MMVYIGKFSDKNFKIEYKKSKEKKLCRGWIDMRVVCLFY